MDATEELVSQGKSFYDLLPLLSQFHDLDSVTSDLGKISTVMNYMTQLSFERKTMQNHSRSLCRVLYVKQLFFNDIIASTEALPRACPKLKTNNSIISLCDFQ